MTQPAASITSYIMYLRLSCSLPVRRLQSSQRRCLQRLSTPSTKHHHVSTTCSSQCRRVLSSLSDGNKRNGPVPINRTPRGRASSSRATSSSSSTVNGHSHNNNHSNSKGFETLNDRAKRNGDDHNNLNNNQHQQFQYTNNNNNSNGEKHGPEHYLRGGLPCEPAAPPFFLADYGEESLYTLVLLRHGESEWNCHPHRFTGWVDVGLTKKGEMEARTAGRLLYENEIELDHAFTSVLRRASFSCNMALNMAKQHWVPVTKTWRLNERHYGQLQGYNKDTAYKELQLDQELVMQMRRSYDVRPPAMEDDHTHWHGNDRRYSKLTRTQLDLTRTESLKDCAERILPYFNKVVVPAMRAGNKCFIVSHANTIRTLIKHIDNISDEDIKGMSIPTGIPLLYRLDKDMKPVDPHIEQEFRYMLEPKGYTWGTSRAHGFHGVYLGDIERLQDIQRKRDSTNRDWQRIILRNIAKDLLGEADDDKCDAHTLYLKQSSGRNMLSVRQLWFQIHKKMQLPEYNNMLLLIKMEDELDELMHKRRKKFLTVSEYERMLDRLHLGTKGQVVEPFVALSDQRDREKRQQLWYESMALDLEEECLIK